MLSLCFLWLSLCFQEQLRLGFAVNSSHGWKILVRPTWPSVPGALPAVAKRVLLVSLCSWDRSKTVLAVCLTVYGVGLFRIEKVGTEQHSSGYLYLQYLFMSFGEQRRCPNLAMWWHNDSWNPSICKLQCRFQLHFLLNCLACSRFPFQCMQWEHAHNASILQMLPSQAVLAYCLVKFCLIVRVWVGPGNTEAARKGATLDVADHPKQYAVRISKGQAWDNSLNPKLHLHIAKYKQLAVSRRWCHSYEYCM